MATYYFTPLQSQTPWLPGACYTVGAYFELTQALANGDQIVFQNAVTPSGITAVEVLCYSSQLDSNASPTGAFELGDSNTYGSDSSYAAARYISGGAMGSNQSGKLVLNYSNVAPSFVSGVQVNGVGYNYFNDENSTSNEADGFFDLIYTVTSAPATAAATGTVWVYFTYYCVGNP